MPSSSLDNRIQFWQDALSQYCLLMDPAVIYLVEETIKDLVELKKIK